MNGIYPKIAENDVIVFGTLMQECSRILKPGGGVLVADWKMESIDGPPIE